MVKLNKCLKKNSGLNWIRAHDLCDTDEVLCQLTYQATLSYSVCDQLLVKCRSGLNVFSRLDLIS